MGLDVLVADQDVELAQLYCRFLADHGFSAQAAARGLECLGMVRQQAPGILVLDRELPEEDARGVLACLREEGLWLPVIITTWNASLETSRQLVEPPVVLCLRKFFPLPALLDGVRLAVNSCGSRGLSERHEATPLRRGETAGSAASWSCSGHAGPSEDVSTRWRRSLLIPPRRQGGGRVPADLTPDACSNRERKISS